MKNFFEIFVSGAKRRRRLLRRSQVRTYTFRVYRSAPLTGIGKMYRRNRHSNSCYVTINNEEFGKGFSEDTLKDARKFYHIYKDRISETVFSLFAVEKSETVFSFFEKESPFTVSWSHYLQLMRIENADERAFYEIEAAKECWSVRTLSRQYNSSLYERLALSRDKEEVLRLSTEGHTVTQANDIIKDPYVLEFVGLDDKAAYSETWIAEME